MKYKPDSPLEAKKVNVFQNNNLISSLHCRQLRDFRD